MLAYARFFFVCWFWFLCFSPPLNLCEHNTYFIHNLLVMVLSMEIYVLLFFFIYYFHSSSFGYFVGGLKEGGGYLFFLVYCVMYCCMLYCCIVYVLKQSFAAIISLFMFILDESTVHVKVYQWQSMF